ncbi:MAG TPA: M14 family zinc carboxypeptidase [Saprospiraceae bacterium]
MIRFVLLLSLFCLSDIISAQSILSRVTFPIDETQTRSDLAKAGLDLTHGHGGTRNTFTTEIQDFQFKHLDALGIRYTVDIPDMNVYRKQQQAETPKRENFLDCQDHTFDEIVPKNFELGSYGGFFSLPQLLDQLDVMQFLYPNLISVRKPIGNFKTWQNNSIYVVKISDKPEIDENEPEVLYTGLHHARELISVSQTIYYMWYLLENYDKDPMIKQILDNTELYFVPVVNPDGMNYNMAGYDPTEDVFTRNHRKNMRDNDGNGSFEPEIDGVDLNRNYGHKWGHDEEGSSGFEGSDTYRGPYAFSEPETQAIASLCNTHDFQFALNHHAYGNLLVYPWGYNNSHTPDSVLYTSYGELLTQLNRFVYGTGMQTVGYITNGDSDDWMYGAKGIYAMTPEVGDPDDGFYPVRERIIPLCQSTLEMNLLGARLVNSLIEITDESPKFIQPGVNPLELGFNRFGLLDGEVSITFAPLSPHILNVPAPINLDLDKFEPHERSLSFSIDNQIAYGSSVKIEIICQQGNYTFRDTLTKVRADFKTLAINDNDLSQWDTSEGMEWSTTTAEYKTGPVSITDSPLGEYLPDSHEAIVLDQQIDLHDITTAYAQFWTKWEIEDHYDYVVFQASTDGESWENLCGEQSKLGSLFQLYEEPLYDGKQVNWVLENVDLSSYQGQTIQLRFLLVSDGFVHRDGFYFDNFKIITIKEGTLATSPEETSRFNVYPNPAGTYFTMELPELEKPSIQVINSLGQPVYTSALTGSRSATIQTSTWTPGLYRYQVLSSGLPVHYGTLSIQR